MCVCVLGRDTTGDVYEGECMNDAGGSSYAHGQGTARYAATSASGGGTYVGSWAHGRREGHGVMTTAHVKPGADFWNTYTGMWAHDNKHGAPRERPSHARCRACFSLGRRLKGTRNPMG